MCESMVDFQSPTTEIRQGKKERRKKKKPQDKNIMTTSAGRPKLQQALLPEVPELNVAFTFQSVCVQHLVCL